ncbi:type II/IV secretion system ATPase subunit [Candidatus Woesearchaeota archaeon]|nr:type II/IV secretion system ATPase subunit [Candidatus Woesearchaeota archaeon]
MPVKSGDCVSYDIVREGEDTVLRADYESCPFFPSLEESEICMSRTADKLVENPGITKIVFFQKRDYEYDYDQTRLLTEIARLHNRLLKQKELFDVRALGLDMPHTRLAERRYTEIRDILYNRLKADPIATYVYLKRILRREKINLAKAIEEQVAAYEQRYVSLIESLLNLLEKTRMIALAQPHLAGYRLGDRGIYRLIFNPFTKPDFMYAKLMAAFPSDGEEIDAYKVGDNEITIFRVPKSIRPLYHLTPPEFTLSEDKYELLDVARRILSEHKPERSEFVDPQRMRSVFFNLGSDLLEELATTKGVNLRGRDVEKLANILVRYTVGFGLVEVLLQDERVQDITINSPAGRLPMFIVHRDYDDCATNIIPTISEGESWATKLRFISGRPLDEANPILDTDLTLPGARARVAVVSSPLNPTGLAFAFRRHRDKPWTLPLFISNRMLSPLAGGVLSFLIDGSRTFLVAGTRSAGKTSLLGSVMTEIMRKYRIITIEDTLELPSDALRGLNYNIQQMKVASAMTSGTIEVSAEEGIRTTLRLGDSCLFVGEVRSTEARALYEAMRVGALANVVAGTIHGDSPYGVYDRVVNDLNVPKTSFKATDIIMVANPVRSADGLHRWRRVTQITEVGKYWENDPLLEKGFTDLFKYDSRSDMLEPTLDLTNGESDVIKAIAANVKEWAGNWDAVWDNIQLRAKIKGAIVDTAKKAKMPSLLEADFVVEANDEFHRVSERIKDEVGAFDNKRIFFEWNDWMKKSIKKLSMK